MSRLSQFTALLVFWGLPILACGPSSCGAPRAFPAPCLYYSHAENWQCATDLPWLDPGNDPRANARILYNSLSAINKNSEKEVLNDETPCQSNTKESEELFAKAIDAAKLPAPEASQLKKVRHKALFGWCRRDPNILTQINFLQKGEFKSYLEGATNLYMNDYLPALEIFQSLDRAKNPWVRETSTYLIGRLFLLQAQINWPGYYDLDKIDKKMLEEAKAALELYLKAYPSGHYVASAQGFLRRTARFQGDQPLYKLMLFKAMEEAASRRLAGGPEDSFPDAELDMAFPSYTGKDILWEYPIAATIGILRTLRNQDSHELAPDTMARLEQAKRAYDKYPDLLPLIRSAVFIANGDLNKALDQKPKTLAHLSLLAQALEAAKRFKDARSYWLQMLNSPEAIQTRPLLVAIGRNYILTGELQEILAKGSPVASKLDDQLLTYLLRQGASLKELEIIASDKRFTHAAKRQADRLLMGRYLLLGQWNKFTKRIEASPNRKTYEKVVTAAKILSVRPDDPLALLNAGSFLQEGNFSPSEFGPTACESQVDPHDIQNQIGTKATQELKSANPPITYYRKALPFFTKSDKNEVEAKLLYYSIRCFRTGDYAHACLWNDHKPDEIAKLSERKEWFKRLKTKYADLKWGKKLRFYY